MSLVPSRDSSDCRNAAAALVGVSWKSGDGAAPAQILHLEKQSSQRQKAQSDPAARPMYI